MKEDFTITNGEIGIHSCVEKSIIVEQSADVAQHTICDTQDENIEE